MVGWGVRAGEEVMVEMDERFAGVGGSLYIPIFMRIYLHLHVLGLYAYLTFVF